MNFSTLFFCNVRTYMTFKTYPSTDKRWKMPVFLKTSKPFNSVHIQLFFILLIFRTPHGMSCKTNKISLCPNQLNFDQNLIKFCTFWIKLKDFTARDSWSIYPSLISVRPKFPVIALR